MEAAEAEPNPEPDDKLLAFLGLGGVCSVGWFEEESCSDLIEKLAVLGWELDDLWKRRWDFLLVIEDDEGLSIISAIPSSLLDCFFTRYNGKIIY